MQQTDRKMTKERIWLDWEGDPLGIAQNTKVWPY